MVGYFLKSSMRYTIHLVLDRTSLENKNKTSAFYNTYQMFDIFYNNTNGDIFEETSLSQEGLNKGEKWRFSSSRASRPIDIV